MAPPEPENKGPEIDRAEIPAQSGKNGKTGGLLVLAALVLAVIVFRVLDVDLQAIQRKFALLLMCALLLYAIFSAVKSFIAFEKHLSEIMATLIFGCAMAAIANLLWDESNEQRAVAFAAAMAWSIGGSARGWSNMDRFDAKTEWQRFHCLCRGWMGIAPLPFIAATLNPMLSPGLRAVFGTAAFLCGILFFLDVRRF
jgi:hypothetical protein